MRLEPLFGWWLIIPVIVICLGIIIWKVVEYWNKDQHQAMRLVRIAAILLLLVCSVVGISIPGGKTSPGTTNLDVIFAIDTTSSMGANDYKSKQMRLEGVKHDLKLLREKFKGAHISVITFDSSARLVLPSTTDSAIFESVVDTLDREVFATSSGSSIDKPFELIEQQLKNSKSAHPDWNRLLYYMGDGEQTSDKKIMSSESLADLVDGGGVFGYGTQDGASMQKNTGIVGDTANQSESNVIKTIDPATKQFVPAVSKLDEEALKKIADKANLDYENRNNADDIVLTTRVKTAVDESKSVSTYINLYWLFAVPLVMLLFWEWKNVFEAYIEMKKTEVKHD